MCFWASCLQENWGKENQNIQLQTRTILLAERQLGKELE